MKREPTRLNMTGDEFKKLIEQDNKNGTVDTLKEVLAMFNGIGDNETIAEYVKRVALTTDEEEEIGIGVADAKAIVADAITKAEKDLEDESPEESTDESPEENER